MPTHKLNENPFFLTEKGPSPMAAAVKKPKSAETRPELFESPGRLQPEPRYKFALKVMKHSHERKSFRPKN
jgi:hypothetical protein